MGIFSCVGVLVDLLALPRPDRLPSEQVHRHALDRADVDEGVFRLGVGQVGSGQDLGVEPLVRVQVVALEPLAVHLVDLVELLAGLGLEGGEGPHGLGRQGAAIHQEQDPLAHARLHQPVYLIDQRERLARPRGHCDQHQPDAIRDRLLDRRVRLDLVRAEPWVIVGVLAEPVAGRAQVASQHFLQGRRRVERRHAPGTVQRVADIVEPEDFAVGRVQERHPEAAKVERAVPDALRVPLRLGQHVLRPQGHTFPFDDPQRPACDEQPVISRPVGGRELGDGVIRVGDKGPVRVVRYDFPALLDQLRIDPSAPSFAFRFATDRASHATPFSRTVRAGINRRKQVQSGAPARLVVQRHFRRMVSRNRS